MPHRFIHATLRRVALEPVLVIDLYRDGFLVRRLPIQPTAGVAAIGSAPESAVWLDSTRVRPHHANLQVELDGTVALVGLTPRGQHELHHDLELDHVIEIPPYVLLLVKRPFDPMPGEPARMFPPLPPPPTPVPPPKPEDGPVRGTCPRCSRVLTQRTLPSSGPAYRAAPVQALDCNACGVQFLDERALASRLGRAGRLSSTAAVREHKRARGLCPACGQNLTRLTLSWGDAWATIEECSACGLVACEDRELDALARIAEGMHA